MDFFRIERLLRKTSVDSSLFIVFTSIEKHNFHAIVRFCQQRQAMLEALSFDEQIIIQLAYCNALFKTKRYHEQIKVAEKVIDLSMVNNIQRYEGEDIYLKTLFQKAQSLGAIDENAAAIHIIEELLKINPHHKPYQRFLKKNYYKNTHSFLKKVHQNGSLIVLVTLTMYTIYLTLSAYLFFDKTLFINTIAVNSIVVGSGVYMASLALHCWKCNRRFMEFMNTIC